MKASSCVGLARSRLPIKFTNVVKRPPSTTMDPRWVRTQEGPSQARTPAQLGRALGRPPVRSPRNTTRKHASAHAPKTSSRATAPRQRTDLPLCPGRASDARTLRTWWHHWRVLRVPFGPLRTSIPCGTGPGVRQTFTWPPRVFLDVTTTGILSVDPRHAAPYARVRQRSSLPTNPAGTTLCPGPPDRTPDGAYRHGHTPAGDPTHGSARRRGALATVSPDRPHHFRPPCGEFGTRRRFHSSTDTEPWIRRLLPQFEDMPRRL